MPESDDEDDSDNIMHPSDPNNRTETFAKRIKSDPNTPINKKDPKTFKVQKLNQLEFQGYLLKDAKKQMNQNKCAGTTSRKKDCQAPTSKGSNYCGHHQDQDPKEKKKKK